MVLALLLSTGCSSTDGEPSREDTPEAAATGAASSEFVPVGSDAFPEHEVEPLAQRVTRDDVAEAADSSADPADGERFAMLAIQYFTESRGEEISRTDLEEIVDARPELVDYIWGDQSGQVALGSDRHLKPEVSGWVRSTWVKDREDPTLRMQAFAWLSATQLGELFETWCNFRVDVVHADEGWRVAEFVNAGGPQNLDPTKKELNLYLDGGEGWRRIPTP